jgi:hypothetical protein
MEISAGGRDSGLPPAQVRFCRERPDKRQRCRERPDKRQRCRERPDKRQRCRELGLTQFVDDHPEVHAAIRGTGDYQAFFGPQREAVPGYGIHGAG